MGCHVHARRKFFEARDYDRKRADYALNIYQQLYAIVKECIGMSDEERKNTETIARLLFLNPIKNGWMNKL